jgi:hypothetical protein
MKQIVLLAVLALLAVAYGALPVFIGHFAVLPIDDFLNASQSVCSPHIVMMSLCFFLFAATSVAVEAKQGTAPVMAYAVSSVL